MKILNYDVPDRLVDEYVKWTMTADGYLNKTIKTPAEEMGINSPANDMERSMRWTLCVKKVMEIHREICKVIDVEYTEDINDEFYDAFHKEIRKLTKNKG